MAPSTTSVEVRKPKPTSSEPSSCSASSTSSVLAMASGLENVAASLVSISLTSAPIDLCFENQSRRHLTSSRSALVAVEAEIARHPAIGHRSGVEIVEHARVREGREALDGQDAQMPVAEQRRDAADQRSIAEIAIEEGGTCRRADVRRARATPGV